MRNEVRKITETGFFVALAVVLRLLFKAIPFCDMPNGGSISLLMLPIILNGYRNDIKYGLIGSICYAVIEFLFDGYSFYLGSFLFDYLLGFGCLGLSGLISNKSKDIKWYIGGIIGVCILRWIFSGISGVVFYKEYAYKYFGSTQVLSKVFLYSFIIYNGPYILGSMILCIIASLPLRKHLYKNS